MIFQLTLIDTSGGNGQLKSERKLLPFYAELSFIFLQCGVVVKSGRLVIWGTGFVSTLLHMQLLGDLGLVTLL